jgi:hypothetical protein
MVEYRQIFKYFGKISLNVIINILKQWRIHIGCSNHRYKPGKFASLNNTCILYTGRKTKSGYTVIDVRLPGHSRFVPMNVHRLRYMIHTHCIQLNPENYHVSHLCHTKTCVSISHLSLEPPHVNNSRQNCLSQQRCLKNHIFSVFLMTLSK